MNDAYIFICSKYFKKSILLPACPGPLLIVVSLRKMPKKFIGLINRYFTKIIQYSPLICTSYNTLYTKRLKFIVRPMHTQIRCSHNYGIPYQLKSIFNSFESIQYHFTLKISSKSWSSNYSRPNGSLLYIIFQPPNPSSPQKKTCKNYTNKK